MDLSNDSGNHMPSESHDSPLLNLPPELLCNIISLLTYDQISNLRPVCRLFNRTCSRLLNRGFYTAERYHKLYFKHVKARLPRRESERRNHHLSRHCDVLSAVETRLSLLSMTYVKYMESNLCCFIPGKVLDEIFRVMRVITSFDVTSNANQISPRLNNENFPRVRELLQELRDISSMAMEHFEDRIVPSLRSRLNSHITSQAGQVSPLVLPSKITRPVASTHDCRLIYSPLPRAVCSLSHNDSSSFEESLTSLSRSFNQWKQAQEKESQSLKNRLRLSEEQNVEMKREIVQMRNLLTELHDKVNALTNNPSIPSKCTAIASQSTLSTIDTMKDDEAPECSDSRMRTKRRATDHLDCPNKKAVRKR